MSFFTLNIFNINKTTIKTFSSLNNVTENCPVWKSTSKQTSFRRNLLTATRIIIWVKLQTPVWAFDPIISLKYKHNEMFCLIVRYLQQERTQLFFF